MKISELRTDPQYYPQHGYYDSYIERPDLDEYDSITYKSNQNTGYILREITEKSGILEFICFKLYII